MESKLDEIAEMNRRIEQVINPTAPFGKQAGPPDRQVQQKEAVSVNSASYVPQGHVFDPTASQTSSNAANYQQLQRLEAITE